MDTYDVVIIGGGLGGLECGLVLSKEGYKVCVLEKNARTGGCFQSFYRNGRLLDTGIHYVGSLDEGKILHQYFKYFGILNRLQLQRLDEEAFDVVCFPEEEYAYAMGHDRFVDGLSSQFPAERENLKKYAARLREVGELIGVEQLRQGKLSAGGLEYFSQSAWEQIGACTHNPKLRQVLAGTNLLYAGIPDKSAFYVHAMINNSNLEGAYRFVGGSMQVTDALTESIRQNGGEVWCGRKVTGLKAEGEKIYDIEVDGVRCIRAKQVISAIHPRRTMELLQQNHCIKKAYISRINSLENSFGVFTAYLMLKKNALPYLNRNYHFYSSEEVWYRSEESVARTCLLTESPSPEDGRYADVISLMTPVYIREFQRWTDTEPGKRGAEYEDYKAWKTEELIELASRWMPGIKGNVESVFSTTPLSFRDFTGTQDGSAYGIVKNCRSPLTTLIAPHTRIQNLWLTGQNLNVHGALGVTLTAMLTCAELLGTSYLARKIGSV